jgi:PAS domain S-box-containing protein
MPITLQYTQKHGYETMFTAKPTETLLNNALYDYIDKLTLELQVSSQKIRLINLFFLTFSEFNEKQLTAFLTHTLPNLKESLEKNPPNFTAIIDEHNDFKHLFNLRSFAICAKLKKRKGKPISEKDIENHNKSLTESYENKLETPFTLSFSNEENSLATEMLFGSALYEFPDNAFRYILLRSQSPEEETSLRVVYKVLLQLKQAQSSFYAELTRKLTPRRNSLTPRCSLTCHITKTNGGTTGTIIEASGSVSMFGLTEAELKGQNLNLIIPEDFREEHDKILERFLTRAESKEKQPTSDIPNKHRKLSALKKTKEGHEEFPIALNIAPTEFSEEEGQMVTATIHDVSELSRLLERSTSDERLAERRRAEDILGNTLNQMELIIEGIKGSKDHSEIEAMQNELSALVKRFSEVQPSLFDPPASSLKEVSSIQALAEEHDPNTLIKILFVDDSDITRALIAMKLLKYNMINSPEKSKPFTYLSGYSEHLGCNIELGLANDGDEATGEIARNVAREGKPYDWIIMDRQMPRCRGEKAIQLIRKLENCAELSPSFISVLSSHESEEIPGSNNYLQKPTNQQLKTELPNVLEYLTAREGATQLSASHI